MRKRFHLQLNVTAYSSALDVFASDSDSSWRNVGAINLAFEFTLCAVVVVERLVEVGIEVGPIFKCKMFAVDTGIDISSDEGSFNEESAGATHRVDKRSFATPAAAQNDASSKHLVDRSFGLSHAIATLMERLAR